VASQIWRGPHIDIPPRTTILDLIAETAARQPERVALVDGISDRTITYVRLVDSIERVASALRAGGAGPGSCLAIYAPNSPEWAIAALAIMRLGGTVTGASPQFKTDELARHLLDIAKEAAAKLGGIEMIVEGDRDGSLAVLSPVVFEQQRIKCAAESFSIFLTAHKSKPALRSRRAQDAAASIASRNPTSVTIAKRPSQWDGMGGVVDVIWGARKPNYFC